MIDFAVATLKKRMSAAREVQKEFLMHYQYGDKTRAAAIHQAAAELGMTSRPISLEKYHRMECILVIDQPQATPSLL